MKQYPSELFIQIADIIKITYLLLLELVFASGRPLPGPPTPDIAEFSGADI